MIEKIHITDDRKNIYKGYTFKNENGESSVFYCKKLDKYLLHIETKQKTEHSIFFSREGFENLQAMAFMLISENNKMSIDSVTKIIDKFDKANK